MAERITHQREEILTYLNSTRSHPTANKIYEHVRSKLPHISRGTVYRNLENLQNEGLVRSVPVSGTSRFESVEQIGNHSHFICTNCNKIIDLHMREVDKKAMTALKKLHPQLCAKSVTVNWSGECEKCRKRR